MLDYKTYHYNDDNINDCGWGCCYRNLQTILSCYKKYYDSTITIPKIQELVSYFNKDINSNNLTDLWIEPYDIYNYLIQKNKSYVGTNILYIQNDSDISKMLTTDIVVYLENNQIYNCFNDLYNRIILHFNQSKLPIVIDNGTYSYCIVIKESTILLIDPHMTHDNNVKKIDTTFLQNSFWMIYIPHFNHSHNQI